MLIPFRLAVEHMPLGPQNIEPQELTRKIFRNQGLSSALGAPGLASPMRGEERFGRAFARVVSLRLPDFSVKVVRHTNCDSCFGNVWKRVP